MSSIDFIEIVQKGELPIVTMGSASSDEMEMTQPRRGARLRVFAQQIRGRASFTLSMATTALELVQHLSRPGSEFRHMLIRAQVGTRRKSPRMFLRAESGATGRIERLNFDSWSELEPHVAAASNRTLWVSGEGRDDELLELLDSIRRSEQLGDGTAPSLEDVSRTAAASSDAHREAIAFRNQLLSRNWPDGRRVAEMAGAGSKSNPHQYAARLRTNGSLLGVWVAGERTYRHPDFQFDALGSVRPAVADLLKILPGDGEDGNGWRRAFWLYSPHALLSGETPADVFGHDPERVIKTAVAEFRADQQEHW